MSASSVKWVRLGDYIDLCDKRNSALVYGYDSVRGVSNTKQIQKTKADMLGRDLSTFHIVGHNGFVFNRRTTRNGERLGLGFNETKKTYIFTEDYVHFEVKNINVLNPTYLYLFFLRDEFDRQVRYNSWGSATEFFNWEDMQRVVIPLPSIEVQKELVNTYNGLKALAEQNEALIEPLSKACEAFIVDCKSKYDEVELGEYIDEYDKRNSDNAIKLVKSVSVTKEFKETNAKVNKNELSGYKIVPPNHIAYVQTTKNEKCFANALNTSSDYYVVSQVDKVIYSKDEDVLNINYLHLIFRGREFDCYAIFNSWGSARETFDWEELCRVKIPLPPIEVQRSIVNLYNCLEEAKKIAQEAREKMKTLCPALVQRAANS